MHMFPLMIVSWKATIKNLETTAIQKVKNTSPQFEILSPNQGAPPETRTAKVTKSEPNLVTNRL